MQLTADNLHLPQASAQGGLTHERLGRLLAHLEGAVPPCMSEAPDWEAVDGWLDELVPTMESLPLPAIPDPSKTFTKPCPGWPDSSGNALLIGEAAVTQAQHRNICP